MSTIRREPGYEYMTLEEFEDALPDKPENERWELIGGRVIRMMVGARWEHYRIIANLDRAVEDHIQDRGLPCRTFRETFWLKQKQLELSVFPDLQVHCGRLEPGQTSIDDPVVLVEVVSKGSDMRDRFEKKALYRKLPSVTHIVFLTVTSIAGEVLTRRDDGLWEERPLEGPDARLELEAIGFDRPLADIYRGVIDG